MAPSDDEERGSQLGDDNLDLGQEADDKGDGKKDPANDKTLPNPSVLELLQEIIDPAADNQLPSVVTKEAHRISTVALPHQTRLLTI